jgi:hypothetical protein
VEYSEWEGVMDKELREKVIEILERVDGEDYDEYRLDKGPCADELIALIGDAKLDEVKYLIKNYSSNPKDQVISRDKRLYEAIDNLKENQ